MTDTAVTPRPGTVSKRAPCVHSPKLFQGIEFAVFRRRAMKRWIKRYGSIFEINVPFFGRSVVVSDPALVRSVCVADGNQLVNVQPNMSNLFGPGSMFALDGGGHRARRRILAPAFHGRAARNFERIIESETLRETANWPQHTEFRTLEPMNRITLNVILTIMFGADETELDELREMVPPFLKRGQQLAFVPVPPRWIRRHSPWRKLDDFRTAFDRVVLRLADRAETDPNLDERTDILALLLRSRRDGLSQMSRRDICDEILTLIGAGHETTAAALAWAFERLRRHPQVVRQLVREIDEGGGEFRRATLRELLRTRTVIDVVGRRVVAPNFALGDWHVSEGRTVLVRVTDLHEDPDVFPHPQRFDPSRFHGDGVAASTWLPFGVGLRRCLGADFAIAEMDVVLRTVLRNFHLMTDSAADEKSYFAGVTHVPRRGGRVVVVRRR